MAALALAQSAASPAAEALAHISHAGPASSGPDELVVDPAALATLSRMVQVSFLLFGFFISLSAAASFSASSSSSSPSNHHYHHHVICVLLGVGAVIVPSRCICPYDHRIIIIVIAVISQSVFGMAAGTDSGPAQVASWA